MASEVSEKITEVSENHSESSEIATLKGEPVNENDYNWMTVRDAVLFENKSEKTIYNRINSGYYASKIESGTRMVGIKKRVYTPEVVTVSTSEISEQTSEDSEYSSESISEDSEVIQKKTSATTVNRVMDFMEETLDKLQIVYSEREKLVRENAEYRLLSDGSQKNMADMEAKINELKNEIFSRDAKIRELEARGEAFQQEIAGLKKLPFWRRPVL